MTKFMQLLLTVDNQYLNVGECFDRLLFSTILLLYYHEIMHFVPFTLIKMTAMLTKQWTTMHGCCSLYYVPTKLELTTTASISCLYIPCTIIQEIYVIKLNRLCLFTLFIHNNNNKCKVAIVWAVKSHVTI